MTKSLTQELQERITEFDKCRIKYKRGSDERFIFLTRIDELQKTLELVQERIRTLKKELVEILTADNDDPDGFAGDVINEKIDKILGGGM